MSTETREHIIDKAKDLFYRYGIRSITMDFIASELGMSKRTLYEIFTNKDSLILACMERGRSEQERDMCEIFNSDANTIEKLVRCYNRIIYYINTTSRSFQLDVKNMRSNINTEAQKYRDKQFQYVFDILALGVKEGLIRTDLNLNIVTSLHNNQILWLSETHLSELEEWGYAEILSVYTKIFLYGIVTEKGRKVLDDNYEQITQTL